MKTSILSLRVALKIASVHRSIVFSTIALLQISVVTSYGATRTVTTLSDSGNGSLREAIEGAGLGDTIVFASNVQGTIKLTTGEISIPNSIYIYGPGSDQLTITTSYQSRILTFNGYDSSVSGLTFSKGYAQGGALYLGGYGGSITDCVFRENLTSPNTSGGAVYINFGSWTFQDCQFLNNKSDHGSGGAVKSVQNNGYKIEFDRCVFSGNEARQGSGGGIWTTYWFNILNCTFSKNVAREGGGIYVNSAFTGTTQRPSFVTGTTFVNNNATAASGGGLSMYIGTYSMPVTGCTFFQNKARTGGGVAGGVSLNDCTISRNKANGTLFTGGGRGGGVFGANLRNSIVAGNNATVGNPDVWIVTSNGYNLVGISSKGDGINLTGDKTGKKSKPLKAKLGIFGDHGGLTSTLPILNGSPAIDAGLASASLDQRGFPRPVDFSTIPNAPVGGNGSDIGAFEVQ